MNELTDNKYKSPSRLNIFTSVALFLLLVVRFPVADFISNFAQLFGTSAHATLIASFRQIQDWTFYFFERWSFIFIGIIVILNRGNLRSLNIDWYFLAVFMISGVAYAIYYFWPSGWAAALISIYLFILINNKYKHVNTVESTRWQIVMTLIIGFFLVLLIISDTKISWAVHWSIVEMPFVVIEEIIFRGLLCMFLKFLGWTIPKIIVLQAILFWLFHTYYMFAYPTLFWIIIPIVSIILGIMVWRYKSITSSTIVHILFNFSRWLLPI